MTRNEALQRKLRGEEQSYLEFCAGVSECETKCEEEFFSEKLK